MHQLIQLDPLARVTVAIGGFAPTRPIPRETPWTAPEGYAYVPVIDRPEYDPETQHRERTLTAEEDGWTVRDLTEEELAARIPAPPEIEGVPKLTIKRRLGAKWATLRAIIATLPEDTQDEWNLAQVIEADDPIFVANSAFLQAALELTEEEFAALLTP